MGNKKLTEEEVIKRINSTFLQDVELISPYINRRSLITLHCKDCEYVWNTSAQNVLYLKKGQKLHQCPNCSKSSYETDVKLNCSFCGKEIYRSPSQITLNKSGYFYCSRECGNKHKNLIRENKGHQIDTMIQTGRNEGMTTLNASLTTLVNTGKVNRMVAERYSLDVGELRQLIR